MLIKSVFCMVKNAGRSRLGMLVMALMMVVSAVGPIAAQQQQLDESWETLRSRPYPQWFKDAKLGVFIHWGVYSVPAYGGPESYAEWYLRGLQAGSEDRIAFMKKHFGEDFTYRDFAPLLKAELFNADEWAEIFEKSGAQYIILVSKHHDGYCLWPSAYAPGWNTLDVGPGRDIVGEVAEAVRQRNIRLGLYYSLPEWNHPLHKWYIDPHDSIGRYVSEHMIPQFKELMSTYKPEVLFTDGEWFHDAEVWHARQLIAWYYQLIGDDAIVNDRWGHGSDIGFITPEYSSGRVETERPWAEVRGLGRSFGLNRNEKLEAYMSPEELIHFFARAVANGGGITINVGPGADGKIPLLQQERLEQLGQWIAINQEAIYASTPWIRPGEDKQVQMQRIDPQIAFNWVRNSPGKPIAEDHFTAHWTGYVQADYNEVYTFSAQADDGMRLYIDDKLILDLWEQKQEGTDSEAMREQQKGAGTASIRLRKGQKYRIRVEYYETLQNASISLYWQSKSLAREVIPTRNLFTDASLTEGNGLHAVYTSMQQHIAYTQNHGNLYAISFEWPDDYLILPVAKPAEGTRICLLGREGDLPWHYQDGKLWIDVRQVKYREIPSHYAWTFKIENYK